MCSIRPAGQSKAGRCGLSLVVRPGASFCAGRTVREFWRRAGTKNLEVLRRDPSNTGRGIQIAQQRLL